MQILCYQFHDIDIDRLLLAKTKLALFWWDRFPWGVCIQIEMALLKMSDLKVGWLRESWNGAVFDPLISYNKLVKMGQKSLAFLTQLVQIWRGGFASSTQNGQSSKVRNPEMGWNTCNYSLVVLIIKFPQALLVLIMSTWAWGTSLILYSFDVTGCNHPSLWCFTTASALSAHSSCNNKDFIDYL